MGELKPGEPGYFQTFSCNCKATVIALDRKHKVTIIKIDWTECTRPEKEGHVYF